MYGGDFVFEELLKNPNLEFYLYGSIAVICSVIVLMGGLKLALVNKVQNKLVRRLILAFSSIAMVFPATYFSCWLSGVGFSRYWQLFVLNALGTILTYWLYENTGLRNLINIVGKTAILKIILAFSKHSENKDVKTSREEAKKEVANLTKEANNTLKKSIDETLKNL